MMKIEEKFLSAYDEYAPAILRHIFYRVNDQILAENLTQETFFKAWKNITVNGTKVDNYKSFFYKIANNLIIDHYRRKDKQPVSLDEVSEKSVSYQPVQERDAERAINSRLIEKYLVSLDDEYREIIIYRYIDELSIKEISQLTGKTPNNVSVMIHRALKMLRDKIDVERI